MYKDLTIIQYLENLWCFFDYKREKNYHEINEVIHYNFSWLCVDWPVFFPDLMLIYEKIATGKIPHFAMKAGFFLECVNLVNICISDGYYYFKCDLFSGCENYLGQKAHCFFVESKIHILLMFLN